MGIHTCPIMNLMEKYLKLSLLCMVLFILLAACKDELNQPAPARELRVLVVNSQNIPVPHAEVRLYTSAESWLSETNDVAKAATDAKGVATLLGLDHGNLWIKATWIDYTTREVFQNTLVSFEPIDPLPANSEATYRVKVNSAKVLKGIRIKEAAYKGQVPMNCDGNSYYNSSKTVAFCGYYPSVKDTSGPGCDLYLLIENSTNNYSSSVGSYFFRSEIKADVTTDNVVFEVNDTITDFRRPYYIGVREHLMVNPEDYSEVTCFQSGAVYPTLADYLASEAGQEHIIKYVDRYIAGKVPLLNVKDSVLPSYPADEVTFKLSSYSDQNLKLHLEWIYQ